MHPPVQLNPAHSTEKLKALHPNPRPQKPTTNTRRPNFATAATTTAFTGTTILMLLLFLFLSSSPNDFPPGLPCPGPVTFHRVTRLSPCTGGQIQNCKRQTRSKMCEPGEKCTPTAARSLARSLGRSIDLGRCRRWACTCSLGRAGTGGLSVRCALARSLAAIGPITGLGNWALVAGWLVGPGPRADQ